MASRDPPPDGVAHPARARTRNAGLRGARSRQPSALLPHHSNALAGGGGQTRATPRQQKGQLAPALAPTPPPPLTAASYGRCDLSPARRRSTRALIQIPRARHRPTRAHRRIRRGPPKVKKRHRRATRKLRTSGPYASATDVEYQPNVAQEGVVAGRGRGVTTPAPKAGQRRLNGLRTRAARAPVHPLRHSGQCPSCCARRCLC